MSLTTDLNRLAGTNAYNPNAAGWSAQGAANVLAGTSGLSLQGALNAATGSYGLGILAALNRIAGTTGVGPDQVLANVTQVPNLLSINQASVETDLAGLNGAGNCTFTRTTLAAADGSASMQVTSSASGQVQAGTSQGPGLTAVVPGRTYSCMLWAQAPSITASATCRFIWWQADGLTLSAVRAADDSPAANLSTSFQQYKVSAIAPSDAAFCTVRVRWTAVGAGEVVNLDKFGIFTGTVSTWVI